MYWRDRKVPTLTLDHGYYGGEVDVEGAVFGPAFRIVKRLADAGVGWNVVEGVLEGFKETSEAVYPDGGAKFWSQ